ncbi:MAG: hypothetical protein R2769_15480 [Saprospiraceae bacterium]
MDITDPVLTLSIRYGNSSICKLYQSPVVLDPVTFTDRSKCGDYE